MLECALGAVAYKADYAYDVLLVCPRIQIILRYLGHLLWPTPRTAVGCNLVRKVQMPLKKRMTMSPDGSTVIQW